MASIDRHVPALRDPLAAIDSPQHGFPVRDTIRVESGCRWSPLLMRTDQSRRAFTWSELLEGRLRQGWGYREDQDLELLARIRRAGGTLDEGQQATWRGNRLLLPTEPGAMATGDLVVLPHLPRHGTWSIARVTGGKPSPKYG